MSVDQLEVEILKLPREIRARLAERLLSSLKDASEAEKAWIAESERRYRQFEVGEEKALDVEDVVARLRQEFPS